MSLWSAQSGDTLNHRHIAIDRPMKTTPALSLVSPLTKNSCPANQESKEEKPKLSLVPSLPNAGVNFPIGDFSVNFYDGIYKGETKEGVPHGIGVWTLDNGWCRCSHKGRWYMGERVGKGVWKENICGKSFESYKGLFDGNKKWGAGTLLHSDSESSVHPGRWKYCGWFENDQMNGYGILVNQSMRLRSRYAGQFLNNKRYGHGVEIFFNEVGEIQETIVGHFENNFITGNITVTRPNGFIFTGNQAQYYQDIRARGFCEGVGVMINSVDTGFMGVFEQGQITGVKWRDIERTHPETVSVGMRNQNTGLDKKI